MDKAVAALLACFSALLRCNGSYWWSYKAGNLCITSYLGTFEQPLLQRKSNKYYIFCLCVCSLGYPACIAQVSCCVSIVACPAVPYYFTLSHKRHCFRGNVTEHKTWVDFLYKSIWNIIAIRNERDMIINVYRSSYKVPVSLLRF